MIMVLSIFTCVEQQFYMLKQKSIVLTHRLWTYAHACLIIIQHVSEFNKPKSFSSVQWKITDLEFQFLPSNPSSLYDLGKISQCF